MATPSIFDLLRPSLLNRLATTVLMPSSRIHQCTCRLSLLILLAGCAEADVRIAPRIAIDRMVFLGNSITESPPNPQIGWAGHWGMAATDSVHDYVHLLAAQFPGASYASANIATFETSFRQFDLASLDDQLRSRPDVVVIELGDNVTDLTAFAPYFTALVNHVAAETPGIVLCTSTWWNQYFINLSIRRTCTGSRAFYVNISNLESDANNRGSADTTYANVRLAEHPGNRGMARIADAIYRVLRP